MKLFTKEQYTRLLKNGSPQERDKDHIPVVKLFFPFSGATWLLTELDPDEPQRAFGLCDLGIGCPELGYVDLEELQSVKRFGLGVERDLYFTGRYPISVYAAAARSVECITDDDNILQQYVKKQPEEPRPGWF